MKRLRVFFVAVISALGFVAGASAQNVVLNGRFDHDITTNWAVDTFSAAWDSTQDCCGDPTSGSLLSNPSNNGLRTPVAQCVPFNAATNSSFGFGGWIKVNAINPNPSTSQFVQATINAQFYLGTECTGGLAGSLFTVGVPAGVVGIVPGPWTSYSMAAQTTPPGALSVQVLVKIQRNLTISASFDTLFLGSGQPNVDLAITMSRSGNFSRGSTAATYVITVSNVGVVATNGGLVSVTDTLPVGLTASALSGSGWACVLGTRTCTRSGVLGGGGSYPPITLIVSVASNAPGSVVNSATVSGGSDANAVNNTVTDTTNTVSGFSPAIVDLLLLN